MVRTYRQKWNVRDPHLPIVLTGINFKGGNDNLFKATEDKDNEISASHHLIVIGPTCRLLIVLLLHGSPVCYIHHESFCDIVPCGVGRVLRAGHYPSSESQNFAGPFSGNFKNSCDFKISRCKQTKSILHAF
jgi:hypothetical protein